MCCKMVMKKKKNTRPLYQMPIRTTTKSSTSVSTIQPSVTTQRPSLSTTNNPDKIQLSKYTVIGLPNMHLPKNVTVIFCKLFNLLRHPYHPGKFILHFWSHRRNHAYLWRQKLSFFQRADTKIELFCYKYYMIFIWRAL